MSQTLGSPFDWEHYDYNMNMNNKCVKTIDCKNLEITDGNASYLFSRFDNLEEIKNFDSSSITNMNSMYYLLHFYGTAISNPEKFGITTLDTSSVTDMGNMFKESNIGGSLDLSNFNTRLVTNMKNMFIACRAETINLSKFYVETVINAETMFLGCINLTKIIATNWTTNENIKNTTNMFSSASQLPNYSSDKTSGEYAKPIADGGYFTPPEEA